MSPLVIRCPDHGVFPSTQYAFLPGDGVSPLTLSGNTESCPVPGCRRMARLVDGVFTFDANAVATVITAPDWSIDALDGLRTNLELLERLLRNDSMPDGVAQAWTAKVETELADRDDALATAIAEKLRGAPRSTALRVVQNAIVGLIAIKELYDVGRWSVDLVAPIVKRMIEG